jgi:hypothetical protein
MDSGLGPDGSSGAAAATIAMGIAICVASGNAMLTLRAGSVTRTSLIRSRLPRLRAGSTEQLWLVPVALPELVRGIHVASGYMIRARIIGSSNAGNIETASGMLTHRYQV